MEIEDLETYEEVQLEVVIRGMTIREFVKKYGFRFHNSYVLYGKNPLLFDVNGDIPYDIIKK